MTSASDDSFCDYTVERFDSFADSDDDSGRPKRRRRTFGKSKSRFGSGRGKAGFGASARARSVSSADGEAADGQDSADALDNDPAAALNYAVRLLTRREYSLQELTEKLSQRYTDEALQQALQRCVEEGWQSDERYADMLLRHFLLQGYGPVKFRMECRKKGVGSELQQTMLEQTDWKEVAAEYVRNKVSPTAPMDFAARQKLLQKLGRRGFRPEECFYALRALTEHSDSEDVSDF